MKKISKIFHLKIKLQRHVQVNCNKCAKYTLQKSLLFIHNKRADMTALLLASVVFFHDNTCTFFFLCIGLYYGTNLKYLAIEVNTTMNVYSLGYQEGLPIYRKWEELVNDMVKYTFNLIVTLSSKNVSVKTKPIYFIKLELHKELSPQNFKIVNLSFHSHIISNLPVLYRGKCIGQNENFCENAKCINKKFLSLMIMLTNNITKQCRP